VPLKTEQGRVEVVGVDDDAGVADYRPFRREKVGVVHLYRDIFLRTRPDRSESA
jgi:hypothetical protein